ncbi:Uncharacterized protein AC501_0437 [Pseudomonas amygdali pv. lachrymans]|nr:Uncharacterized protein AC501_0437 [Pseudomonas amygdali pv. lachrymans]
MRCHRIIDAAEHPHGLETPPTYVSNPHGSKTFRVRGSELAREEARAAAETPLIRQSKLAPTRSSLPQSIHMA